MIPIYRAKKINSDEYVEGFLIKADDYTTNEDEDQIIYFIMHKMENYRTDLVWDFVCNSRVDPSTLAIHFHDMLDSQGNKIFASLSEDGKGGDKMTDGEYFGIAKYIDCEFVVEYENVTDGLFNQNFEVIGIQE